MQITIVIPVFNRAACLLRTLQSVPADYPLIVVDNGSNDGSAAMAEDFCRHRPGALFASEPTPGAPAARNRGLALCQTEWVYFFDSDDEFTAFPCGISPASSPLPADREKSAAEGAPPSSEESAESLDMLCFPVRMVVDGKESVRDYRPTADAATHILSAMLSTQSMVFRTAWLRSIGGWDNRCRIWNDWELGLRALLHHPRLQWIGAGHPCHRIYVHADSITGPSYGARWQRIVATLTIVREQILSAGDRRALRAFRLRCHIVSGHLLREGHGEGAEAVRALADSSLTGRLLQCYTAHGGRGAWRIALALINI